MRLLLGLLGLLLTSCVRLETYVDALNARQVESCIYVVGFPYPFALVRAITATGGATMETCQALR